MRMQRIIKAGASVMWAAFLIAHPYGIPKDGDFKAFNAGWVHGYNVHKMYAGLRDAWMYANSKQAKNMFLHFCDWAINITSSLTDAQIQSMLDTEQDGMNEVLADAYAMTGDKKYLIHLENPPALQVVMF